MNVLSARQKLLINSVLLLVTKNTTLNASNVIHVATLLLDKSSTPKKVRFIVNHVTLKSLLQHVLVVQGRLLVSILQLRIRSSTMIVLCVLAAPQRSVQMVLDNIHILRLLYGRWSIQLQEMFN